MSDSDRQSPLARQLLRWIRNLNKTQDMLALSEFIPTCAFQSVVSLENNHEVQNWGVRPYEKTAGVYGAFSRNVNALLHICAYVAYTGEL